METCEYTSSSAEILTGPASSPENLASNLQIFVCNIKYTRVKKQQSLEETLSYKLSRVYHCRALLHHQDCVGVVQSHLTDSDQITPQLNSPFSNLAPPISNQLEEVEEKHKYSDLLCEIMFSGPLMMYFVNTDDVLYDPFNKPFVALLLKPP